MYKTEQWNIVYYSMLHRYLIYSFVYWYNKKVPLLMTCMYVQYVRPPLTYSRVILINRVSKVAKPARGQLNREIKCPCRCIRGKH